MDDILELRAQYPHFRVLIIGRANAGKITILKKVCNTTDEPRIYDPHGKEVWNISLSRTDKSKYLSFPQYYFIPIRLLGSLIKWTWPSHWDPPNWDMTKERATKQLLNFPVSMSMMKRIFVRRASDALGNLSLSSQHTLPQISTIISFYAFAQHRFIEFHHTHFGG